LADESKYEGRGNDAEKGRRREGRKLNPDQRRNEIDDPERKDRDQPQKQKIAESVVAKALRQPLRQGTRAANEIVAHGALSDQEDPNPPDRGAHARRRTAENGAEQDSTGHREIEANGNR